MQGFGGWWWSLLLQHDQSRHIVMDGSGWAVSTFSSPSTFFFFFRFFCAFLYNAASFTFHKNTNKKVCFNKYQK